MQDLRDKSVIITGSASGIGAAAAQLAAKAGARLTLADVDKGGIDKVAAGITADGGVVQTIKADMSSEADVKAMVDLAISTYGRLDGAFNNAGIPPRGVSLADLSVQDFQKCMSVNLLGVFLCMKCQIPEMLKTGGGAIVNTASVASVVSAPFAPEYVASKHGVLGLTRSAAQDYAGRGLRINAILPGGTKTAMFETSTIDQPDAERLVAAQHPIGRMAHPSEPAQAALWLLSDAASFVVGAGLVVDGGYSMI